MMVSEPFTNQIRRRTEICDELVTALEGLRFSTVALLQAGWCPDAWQIPAQMAQKQSDLVQRMVAENRCLLHRSIQVRLERLIDVLDDARCEFLLARQLGSDDASAQQAMDRARQSLVDRAELLRGHLTRSLELMSRGEGQLELS